MAATMKGIVRCGDANIFYEIYGRGEPLVMLHGNGEDHRYFRHQVRYFSRRYRVVLIDTRGHGKSTMGSRPLDFKLLADDVATVLEQLNIAHANILGFSDGANIAIYLALRHPERVGSLILNGGNLNPMGIKASTQIPIIMGYQTCKLFTSFSNKAKRNLEILSLMVEHPSIAPERLERIKVPVLVIAGQYDMVREKHTILIAKSLPHAQLAILPNGTHFIASEMPDEFNQRVMAFLSGLHNY